jgi:hypothetical protein
MFIPEDQYIALWAICQAGGQQLLKSLNRSNGWAGKYFAQLGRTMGEPLARPEHLKESVGCYWVCRIKCSI